MMSLRKFEWEAIAGLVAAATAIILHFLHLTDVNVLRMLTLVLVALLFMRDLRNEDRWHSMESTTKLSVRLLEEIREAAHPAEIDLIGPTRLRQILVELAERVQGEVVWFNACPQMFVKKEVCDSILDPFLANPALTAIRFVFDNGQREHWGVRVESTLKTYLGRGTVTLPTWADLDSGVAFVIAETDTVAGKAEAMLGFWGEPFMAVHHDHKVPSYLVHVRAHSELIGRLREVERACRVP